MSAPPSLGVYQALLRLYPRSFRDEYGPDMALLLANQLRDEPAVRVWARAVVDVAITLPTRHLEAHMNRPASSVVPLLFTGVGLTGVLVALIGGSSRGMLAVGLSVAAVAAALAVASWRHTRPLATSHPASAHWWKFLTGGAGILAAVVITTTLTGELPEGMWWPMMITLTCALLLLATGLVLGVAHRTGRPPGNRLLRSPPR